MTGDTHYELETLAELAEGLLDAAEARQVREHLAVCDPCGELLADLAAVREVLAATPTPAMPMGVALRIDKALAAEAETGRGGVGLAEPPDWDELMRDAPWERPMAVPEPVGSVNGSTADVPEPVRLGVVSDDGTIVPARTRSARRRRWALPAVAAAAAAAVVGTAVVSTNLLASGGSPGGSAPVALPSTDVAKSPLAASAYKLTDSGYNYSDYALRQPMEQFFGFAQAQQPLGSDNAAANQAAKCVGKVGERNGLETFAADQGQYNGQEALVVVSWKDRAAKKIRIDIVDPFNCKNLRKAALGRW
ncbi:zf-HC2 domain-containing protein [Nonomuraea sp. LP-02]|uniref:anti-sigma factor family protein n=1 Tax=Nonomuraea sp. LP-02 TaxID=3097960 RepID=UPI002E369B48|nr:zf-HC2 domain-containing protein [Nonomuraea sp. LP-02]MED7928585.1 zf-HC2 domain-containing protein [Nonomuraea sp. LP-02]